MKGSPEERLAVLAGPTGATGRKGSDSITAKQGQGKTSDIFLSFSFSFSFSSFSSFVLLYLFLSTCHTNNKE
jgi:hypothetical protein